MRGLQFFLTRSVGLLSAAALLLLVFSLGLLIYSAWGYVERIAPVEQHLDYLVEIQGAEGRVHNRLLDLQQPANADPDAGELDALRDQLRLLRDSGASLVASTPAAIDQGLQQFEGFDGRSPAALNATVNALRGTFNRELVAHQSMVNDLENRARRGRRVAIGLAIGLLGISALLWAMVRQRILAPLDKLADQMTLLARHDYSALSAEDADPMLYPMIERYNRMAQRLRKLEQVQQQRQETLTQEVRNATHMLLQQQRRLAQAERLGAVGEVAAGVAHELRNPLTSVLMALENLRHDTPEPEMRERIDMINDEVKRITRLLNQLLDQARQRPESPVMLDLGEELEDLISLAVYQLHEDISVRFKSRERLVCLLPRSALWQALLNLILNAAHILGDSGGNILVEAGRQENLLEIRVTDTGPGFPPAMLEAGVQPFRSWRAGGTGLGLVMVRRFASDLGGELLLSNRDEGGACVTLRLPCQRSES